MVSRPAASWVVFVGCLLAVLVGCGRPPRIADNEAAMTATDALWTAVTARRTDLLEQSASQLQKLHDDARLDEEAYRLLEKIVSSAREGDWSGAANDLKWFIAGQHRS